MPQKIGEGGVKRFVHIEIEDNSFVFPLFKWRNIRRGSLTKDIE